MIRSAINIVHTWCGEPSTTEIITTNKWPTTIKWQSVHRFKLLHATLFSTHGAPQVPTTV